MHTHEEVVGVGVGATNLEQLHQVVELAMNITTDSNWAFLTMRDQFWMIPRGGFFLSVGLRAYQNIPLAAHSTLPVKLRAPMS
jgi:hypothetical protein